MPRVPSDPAQVIVNHASFRVQLGANSAHALGLGTHGSFGSDGSHGPLDPLTDTARIPVVPRSSGPTGAPAGRRKLAPVVWSGRAEPGDPLAGELSQAVRNAGAGAATQLLPRIDETTVLPPAVPTVVGPRTAGEPTGLLSGVRPARGAYDPADDAGDDEPRVGYIGEDEEATGRRPRGRRADQVRHAWYPHRRMNLGIVLLPLRIFLGFVCVYAGMGKLCDRVYFDGGERGSMVTWLSSLHPWALAEPLRDSALNHPVGAGLSIAFLQIVVGVLTVFGLWQRVAAVLGAGLSVALLVTVSWRTVPVYDAPDFIYLAAWSPLIIAGAPVYSIDGHLAGDAWRRLGPRVGVWDLRRRVLRRGTALATVIIGLTLLVGSVLGAAVRATTGPDRGRPGDPYVVPSNSLPGSPLPPLTGGSPSGSAPEPSQSVKTRKKAHRNAVTQAPTTTPGYTETTSGAGATTRATSGGSGAQSGTGSGTGTGSPYGSSGTGSGPGSDGTSQAPRSPAGPTGQAPAAPPQPSARPSQGAIGGLLGSHSPTGLLLGMEPGRSGPGGARSSA
ncbi:DoxX family protein [Streptomyces sp.]|uniref:DoxX family protein n=1 Tax=Streptomyces sp. TaxID=1931 RepID=UPI002F4018DC